MKTKTTIRERLKTRWHRVSLLGADVLSVALNVGV